LRFIQAYNAEKARKIFPKKEKFQILRFFLAMGSRPMAYL
jgi:hypothetical protein